VIAPQAIGRSDEVAGERRSSFREAKSLLIGTIVHSREAVALDCTIIDLSENGARVMVPNPYVLPDHLVLLEPKSFLAHEASVRWCCGVVAGLSFDKTFSLDDGISQRDQTLRTFAVETATRCGF